LKYRVKRLAAPPTAAATAARRGVAWFAVVGLLFQIFLVTSHIHVDEDGWVGLALLPGVAPLPAHSHDIAFHRHDDSQRPDGTAAIAGHHHDPGAAAGQAVPENDNDRIKHPDCQICQSSPVVSASFIAITIEFTPAAAADVARLRIADIDAKRIEPRTHAQPRAPPIQA
jgi:hypothetical protein